MKSLCLPLALTCLALSGCGTGQVFRKTARVIADPSIQVGDARDQITSVSLSLYATPTVNPNPDSADVPTDATPQAAQSDMYEVNLASHSQQELLDNLRSLVAYVEADVHTASTLDVTPRGGSTDRAARETLGGGGNTPWVATCSLPAHESHGAPFGPPIPMAMRSVGEYGTPAVTETEPQAPVSAHAVATPISFKVIELKDDSLFLGADYDALQTDLKKALGTTYLAHEDYVLQPGQFKFIEAHSVIKGTRYIAVLAAFHDVEKTTWKSVLHLEPFGRTYALMAHFTDNGVNLLDEN